MPLILVAVYTISIEKNHTFGYLVDRVVLKYVLKFSNTIVKIRLEIVAIPKTIKDHAIIRTLYLF